jgi:peptide/nickel transport system substrate-binding protein
LPVESRWYSAFPEVSHSFDGWRLEPTDTAAFGENAKYYEYDIAEAKKLLAAAGFPDGLDVKSTYYQTSNAETIQARQGMNADAGFRFEDNVIDYVTEFIPNYRDVQGDFEGIIYRGTIVISADPIDRMSQLYWSKSGFAFYGFDVNGNGDKSGDPYVDETIEKARRETDVERAKALINDLERYLAPKAYAQNAPAGATQFVTAWPVIGNFQALQGSYHSTVRTPSMRWWVDATKAPLA